jgi:hypothetical protein
MDVVLDIGSVYCLDPGPCCSVENEGLWAKGGGGVFSQIQPWTQAVKIKQPWRKPVSGGFILILDMLLQSLVFGSVRALY